MEQQEIDRLIAESERITREFRASLEPAVDENGQPRMVDDEGGEKTGNKIQLLEATGKQLEKYITTIQKICTPEIIENFQDLFAIILDCKYLYILDSTKIQGKLPRVNFRGTIFFDKVDFESVIFSGWADFINTTFYEEGCFRDTKFLNLAHFKGSKFLDMAQFGGAKFFWADFENAIFSESGWAYFADVKFLEGANFRNVTFFEGCNFNNTKFKNSTRFSNVVFHQAPLFHNAILHQDTSFEGAQFLRYETEDDYRAYRTLKQHTNSVHARLEENMFFALEQETKRNIDAQNMGKNWFSVIISWFYDFVSGYGQNVTRPILILFIFGLLVFPSIYWALNDITDNTAIVVNVVKELKEQNIWGWYQSLPVSFGYSMQSIFNPLVFFNKDSAFIATHPFIRFVAGIQSVFTIAVAALWLLAVRNRFQKGS